MRSRITSLIQHITRGLRILLHLHRGAGHVDACTRAPVQPCNDGQPASHDTTSEADLIRARTIDPPMRTTRDQAGVAGPVYPPSSMCGPSQFFSTPSVSQKQNLICSPYMVEIFVKRMLEWKPVSTWNPKVKP